MRNRSSVVKWNLFFNYAATVVSIINGLAIIPFYLKFIENGLFGAWLATGNILVWLTIVEPGVGDVLQQRVAAAIGLNDKVNAGKYITSGIVISIAISIIVLVVGFCTSYFILDVLKLTSEIDTNQLLGAFLVAVVSTSITMVSYAFIGSNQGLQSSLGIGLIYLGSNILGITLNIYLLFHGFGLYSIAYATLFRISISCIGYILYLCYRLKKYKISLSFDKNFFVNFSKLFSYTFIGKISSTIISNLDLILVARFIGPEMVTMLELTRRPIRILQGFTDRVSTSFIAPLANLKGEGDYSKIKSIFIRFIYLFIWTSTFIIFGFVALNENLLAIWAGKSIFLGNPLNILLSVTLWISSLLYNLSNFSYALGNIKDNSTISMAKSIIYLILMLGLGYLFGVYGVILASLLSILASEAWYYPSVLNSILIFESSEVKFFMIETLKVLGAGAIVAAAILIFKPEIKNWIELIKWCGIYSFSFAILFIPISTHLQVELNGIMNLISSKFKRQF
jgi:Na+-driven multidrug efflux pump